MHVHFMFKIIFKWFRLIYLITETEFLCSSLCKETNFSSKPIILMQKNGFCLRNMT